MVSFKIRLVDYLQKMDKERKNKQVFLAMQFPLILKGTPSALDEEITKEDRQMLKRALALLENQERDMAF